jgi:phosphate acyltransferase
LSTRLTIAVDLMSGDLGPRSALPAALTFAQANPDTSLLLVGDSSLIPAQLPVNTQWISTSQIVTMEDRPAQALRHKQDSSMWHSIVAVADGRADACVSAGNTGALMAMGKFQLKTFPGIDRPAICKAVPTSKGSCVVLDLGANVDCSSEQLVQFALMGSVLASTSGVLSPSVGLLNIGSEEVKGNEQIRFAASLLDANEQINYQGYVEGDGIFSGAVDVVVCDGFVGNVALKVSEGVARLLTDYLIDAMGASWFGRLSGQIAKPLLRKWHMKFDPARYNGASFLGLQGVVVKSHGSADEKGFGCALAVARDQAFNEIPQKINQQLADCLL